MDTDGQIINLQAGKQVNRSNLRASVDTIADRAIGTVTASPPGTTKIQAAILSTKRPKELLILHANKLEWMYPKSVEDPTKRPMPPTETTQKTGAS